MKKNEQLTIHIDMDGVLADFKSAAQELQQKLPMNSENLKFDEILDFSTFKPIPGSKEAVQELLDMGHDIYIASTAPWNNPKAWMQKRLWIEEHFPALKRKLTLTHHKNLLVGDVLIDDTTYRGQKDFQGTFIQFLPKQGIDWPFVVQAVRNVTLLLCKQ
tara:strand:+ start:768 stop:1247 length:480 start_codon:yes stop_codon:yes gene_type:complete